MTNYQFLKKYQRLQEDIMFDRIIDLGFALVGYSQLDHSPFWNNALTDQVLWDEQITKVENTLKSLKRKPTFYFENKQELYQLRNILTSKNYKKSFEDSWQFWEGGEIDEKYFDSVMKVSSKSDLEIFLGVFDRCYQKNDPQNPYGELGEYLKAAEEAWHKHNANDRLEYFMVYKGDKPVAVSTLTNFEGLGYISNVGSLREVRGEGFGKAVTLYCVKESIAKGNKEHCLATEEGHYPNEFYKRIGFPVRFTTIAFRNIIKI